MITLKANVGKVYVLTLSTLLSQRLQRNKNKKLNVYLRMPLQDNKMEEPV